MSGARATWQVALSTAVLVVSCGSKSRSPPLNDDPTVHGTAGSSGSGSCERFKTIATTCFDGFCAADAATSAFCACWAERMDIDARDCSCIPLDLDSVCRSFNLQNVNDVNFACGDLRALGNICN
jgi:hypothetical protein